MGEGKHLYKKKCPVLFGHYLFRVGGYKPSLWSFLITFRGSKRLSGWCAWMTEGGWGGGVAGRSYLGNTHKDGALIIKVLS